MKNDWILIFLGWSCLILAQNNQTIRYEIEGFQIAPNERKVYGQQMTGGTDIMPDGSEIHWDGYKYVPIKEINFNTTSLIFAGNMVTFKEYFPIKSADIPSLKVVHYSIGYDDGYTTILSPNENKVYVFYNNWIFETIDLKGVTHLTKRVFTNGKGKLFYIPYRQGYLKEINHPIDEETLQHVVNDYYTDKNGLYHFSSEGVQKLESGGNLIYPGAFLFEKYFIYGYAAYPYGERNITSDIRLNSGKLCEIKTPYASYLGDGEKLFKLLYSSRDNIQASLTPQDIIQKGTPPDPINLWKWFDIIAVGGNKKGNTLYYSSPQIYAGGGSYYSLIKTPSGFYGITGSSSQLEAIRLDQVMIYHQDKKEYEPIEIDQFRRVTTNFYIYKNRMYYSDSHPFETNVDIQKLYPIRHEGKATDFYTDGQYLMGGYNLGNLQTEEREGQTWYRFKNPPLNEVDWESLQVVKNNLLVDKKNIYQENSSVMQIIPIKDLKLDVKIIEVLK